MSGQSIESLYVCPLCKQDLELRANQLHCPACKRSYPCGQGIPNFLAPALDQPGNTLIHRVDQADRGFLKWASGLYEGRFWYPLVIRMYCGRKTTSLADLVRKVRDAVNIPRGRVLDVACGSATFGRRLASPDLEVFGIDISAAMLLRGDEYIRRDRVTNIHLARCQVEHLPFRDGFLDFGVCSGSLHLFPDPVAALAEIARVLKPGARLVGLTFHYGSGGLLRYGWFRETLRKRGTIHVFELPELENDFRAAGFEHFEARILGSGVFFLAGRCLN